MKISPSSSGRRRTSSGVIKGRRDSDSEVLTLRVDAVVCSVRTVISPIKRESCSLVSILLGVKATFVSQLLVIDSSCP